MPTPNPKPRPLEECHVLIIDDQDTSRLIAESLLEDNVRCSSASSAKNIIELCREKKPDLVLMDVDMPEFNGFEACRALQQDDVLRAIPVIFVTATTSDDEQLKCWESGCVDFIPKPVNTMTLWNRVRTHLNHVRKTELLEKLLYLDRLTGAYSRHFYEDHIPALEKHAKRTQSPVSFVLFDIDHFKKYNDHYGHQQGDNCLREVAMAANNSLKRPLDKLIRIGGEEFLIVLPDTHREGAMYVAENVRKEIYNAALQHEPVPLKRVTISAGVATMDADSVQNADEAIAIADSNLYRAKDSGRNTVMGEGCGS